MNMHDLDKKLLRSLKEEYSIKVKRYETTLDFDEWLEYKMYNTPENEHRSPVSNFIPDSSQIILQEENNAITANKQKSPSD